jgi:hypothetical protein
MRTSTPRLKLRPVSVILFLMVAIGVQLPSNLATAQSQINRSFNPSGLSWTHLIFNSEAFLGKISVDVQLAFVSPEEAKRALIASPKGIPISMEYPKVGQLTVNRTIDSTFGAKTTTEDKIWFNPTRASALGRIRTRRGDDDFLKKYRFTDLGVFRFQKEPADKIELKLSPDKWTNIGENFYTHNLKQMGCAVASERSILLYAASVGVFSDNLHTLSLCVFGKRQLHRVRLIATGVQSLLVKYIEKRRDTLVAKEVSLEALKIALETQPLATDLNETENFSFLGLQSNIAIFIDPASGLPVQISGDVPKLGTLHLKLTEVSPPDGAN